MPIFFDCSKSRSRGGINMTDLKSIASAIGLNVAKREKKRELCQRINKILDSSAAHDEDVAAYLESEDLPVNYVNRNVSGKKLSGTDDWPATKSTLDQLAKARVQVLREAAALRVPSQITSELFDDLPRRVCPVQYRLSHMLTKDEQEFWHAFLANADVFASIRDNTGPRFEGQETGMGWGDICFSTADSIFDLLSQTRTDQIVLYDGKINPVAWCRLLDVLYDPQTVLLFNLDGEAEGHMFIAYPMPDKQVLLAQSVGGFMRANVRSFAATELFRLLSNLIREGEAKPLFGYAKNDNVPLRLTFKIGQRVPKINAKLLLDKMRGLSDTDKKRMRATFKDHFEYWDKYDPDAPIPADFDMDTTKQESLFYYVDPLTFEWQCVDRGIDVPKSEVSIALQSGAVCPLKYSAKNK